MLINNDDNNWGLLKGWFIIILIFVVMYIIMNVFDFLNNTIS